MIQNTEANPPVEISARVFVSHASEDRKSAEKLTKLLEDRDLKCWIAPRDVAPGSDYADEIMKGIENCLAMVLVLSDDANQSKFVKREVERAVSRGKAIFPVRIRDVEPSASLELFIGATQWIDAWQPPMEQWLDRLIGAIQSMESSGPTASGECSTELMPPQRSRSRFSNGPWFFRVDTKLIITTGALFAVITFALWFLGFRPNVNETVSSDLWSTKAEVSVRKQSGHQGVVTSVVFSPDGTLVASSSWDGTIKLWNAMTGAEIHTFAHQGDISEVVFCAEGRCLISGSEEEGIIKVWDVSTTTEIRSLEGHQGRLWSVAINPDDSRLAVGCSDTIKLWDPETGTEIRTLAHQGNAAYSVAFSPDGWRMATGFYDYTITLWNAVTGKEIRTLAGHDGHVKDVVFSPNSSYLASGSSDGTIKLWDVTAGEEIRTLSGHRDSVSSVAFSPDGSLLASGSADETIKLWNANSGEEIRTLTGHQSTVWSVAFSPDGTRIASGGTDHFVRIWTVKK